MDTKIEQAINLFSRRFNCSQAIMGTYGPLFGIEQKTAFKITSGFGAGMGYLQKTCGAVTGAFMVLGLAFGKWKEGDDESKAKTYSLINKFVKEFIKKNESINCLTLLGCDISTQKGLEEARKKGLFETKCKKYVKDAATILEEIIINPSVIR